MLPFNHFLYRCLLLTLFVCAISNVKLNAEESAHSEFKIKLEAFLKEHQLELSEIEEAKPKNLNKKSEFKFFQKFKTFLERELPENKNKPIEDEVFAPVERFFENRKTIKKDAEVRKSKNSNSWIAEFKSWLKKDKVDRSEFYSPFSKFKKSNQTKYLSKFDESIGNSPEFYNKLKKFFDNELRQSDVNKDVVFTNLKKFLNHELNLSNPTTLTRLRNTHEPKNESGWLKPRYWRPTPKMRDRFKNLKIGGGERRNKLLNDDEINEFAASVIDLLVIGETAVEDDQKGKPDKEPVIRPVVGSDVWNPLKTDRQANVKKTKRPAHSSISRIVFKSKEDLAEEQAFFNRLQDQRGKDEDPVRKDKRNLNELTGTLIDLLIIEDAEIEEEDKKAEKKNIEKNKSEPPVDIWSPLKRNTGVKKNEESSKTIIKKKNARRAERVREGIENKVASVIAYLVIDGHYASQTETSDNVSVIEKPAKQSREMLRKLKDALDIEVLDEIASGNHVDNKTFSTATQKDSYQERWHGARRLFSIEGHERLRRLAGTEPAFSDLQDLLNTYFDIHSQFHSRMVDKVFTEKDKLVLAQLLHLRDPSKGVISLDELKPFFRDEASEFKFKRSYAKIINAINGLGEQEKTKQVEHFHEELADRLVRNVTYKKKHFAALNTKFKHDTNVTQTPDGTTDVSNKDGSALTSSLSLRYDWRERKSGTWSLGFAGSMTQYFEDDFKARETENISLTLSDKINFTKWKFASIAPKVKIARDYLKSSGSKEASFDTYTPGATIMLKPIQKKSKFADIWVGVFVLDLEYRDYIGVDRVNPTTLQSKDTLTPSITALGLAMKKYKRFSGRGMGLFNFRDQDSDDNEQTYRTYRLGFSYTFSKDKWTATPDIAIAGRMQANTLGSKRDDFTYEFGVALDRELGTPKVKVKASIRQIEQSSNLSIFEFSNTSFSLGFDAQL